MSSLHMAHHVMHTITTAAMEMLGDDLHGQDVATIFDSFDIDAYGHGVDFETFQNIVEVGKGGWAGTAPQTPPP